jgi:hypothetical protein
VRKQEGIVARRLLGMEWTREEEIAVNLPCPICHAKAGEMCKGTLVEENFLLHMSRFWRSYEQY